MSNFLYLRKSDIEPLVSMEEALRYAQEGFELHGKSTKGLVKASFSPMVAFHANTPNSDIDYRAGTIDSIPALCSAFGFGYADNPAKHGLPSIFAFAVLTDAKTGVPLAIMDGYFLSYVRTGAAAAIASKYLAKRDPSKVGFIGSGNLARFTLKAHVAQYGKDKIDQIKAWSRTRANAEKFGLEMKKELGVNVLAVQDAKEAVIDCDLVYCTTRSRQPIVMNDWVGPGTHINAFGADAPGKQELDPNIFTRAKTVVDSFEQCKAGGEIRDALGKGLIHDVYAELGEIANGWKRGRETDHEITVVDSTGIAPLDIVIYYRVYERASKEGKGLRIEYDAQELSTG